MRYTAKLITILFLALLFPGQLLSKILGVTCFDGTNYSNHRPGFDCNSLVHSNPHPEYTSTPTYHNPSRKITPTLPRRPTPEERRRGERLYMAGNNVTFGNLFFERGDYAQAVFYYRKAKQLAPENFSIQRILHRAEQLLMEKRTRRMGEDKLKAARQTVSQILNATAISPSTNRILNTPALARGENISVMKIPPGPVDLRKNGKKNFLRKISPTTVEGQTSKHQGLQAGYVPKPQMALEDYHYDKKKQIDIILDALEVGSGSYIKSIHHLEAYLAIVGPGNTKIQGALSYIQGMAEGDFIKHPKDSLRNKFDPAPEDSAMLIEAVSGIHKQVLPSGINNPDPGSRLPNPLDWKVQRNRIIEEALATISPEDAQNLQRKDFQKIINTLQKKLAFESHNPASQQALLFFQGLITHFDGG